MKNILSIIIINFFDMVVSAAKHRCDTTIQAARISKRLHP